MFFSISYKAIIQYPHGNGYSNSYVNETAPKNGEGRINACTWAKSPMPYLEAGLKDRGGRSFGHLAYFMKVTLQKLPFRDKSRKNDEAHFTFGHKSCILITLW